MDSKQIKQDIEERILAWQQQLDEKDGKIRTLMEENNRLKTEISRKLILSPSLKERLMGDVGRLLSSLKNDLKKSAVKERDLGSRLESAKAKIDALSAELASQNSIIEKLKADYSVAVKNAEAAASAKAAEISALSDKHERAKAEELKKLTFEFEKKIQEQEADAARQIEDLVKEIAERE